MTLPTVAFIAWGLVPMLFPGAANPAVQARVDPPVVDEMESVRLTLRVDGASQTERLDLGALGRDFEVLGTNTSSQFQSVNGRVQSWVEYQVNLRPKRTGTLEIPALTIAGQSSSPLRVTVRPLAPEVRRAIDRMVFFEVDVSPNPVYVQAQALLTRRLYYASGVQIYSDLPGVPDIPNAVVVPVGETRSTTDARPEGRYGVLEQRYAIFPEQSGPLFIPEISVTSSVQLQSRGQTRRSGIRVSTPELRLDVLPVPAAYPADQPWLPARQVAIRDLWQPATLAFDLGEPVRRKLTIEVTGNTGSAIPPLAPGLPEAYFKQYPEPVQIAENAPAGDVLGTRVQDYSIVPVAPGAVPLPELRLTWWDTANERVRIATADTGQAHITGNPPPAQTPRSRDPVTANERPAAETTTAANPAGTPYPLRLLALTAVVFAFAGWATTWLAMRRRGTKPNTEPSRRSAAPSWNALVAACRQGDAKSMRDAWLRHLGARWQTAPDRTVATIRQHEDGQRLLDRLNRGLYSTHTAETVDGRELIAVTRTLLKPTRQRAKHPLPDLHLAGGASRSSG